MGVSSSTTRQKNEQEWGNTSKEKITEADAMEWKNSSQVNEMEPSKMTSVIDGSLVYGREDDKKMIIQLLLSENYQTDNVTFICIFAASGIGKTTMVQLIYTDKRVEDAFDARVLIGMYENFDEKRLMKTVLESLTGAHCDITESSILEELVKDELAGKKLLLVLDSAENENKSFWNNLSALLSVAAEGSAVLVTTSIGGVANVTGATYCYQLNYLPKSDCWLIFQQLAFCGTHPNTLPEFVKIGKHLVTKCAYNTLCIKMLGALLSYSITEESWKSILESVNLRDVDELGGKILPVLIVCYEFLPSHLKRCFAYCSLFPKGYIFSKHHLVRLWLAQGFIDPVVGRNLEDVGNQYFEELFSRSFFHHSHLHSAKDDKFMMHELIHDLAHYASRNECFRFRDCVQVIPKGVRYFSLVPFEYQTVVVNQIIVETEKLQSFIVADRSTYQLDSDMYPIIHLVGLSDLFLKVTCLRVLDLSNTDMEELPSCINLMRSLRYLGFNNTKIESIPQEIGNLIDLHTLEANGCYNLVEFPKSIQELTNLHHLGVTKEAGFIRMPAGIRKLTNLRSLSMFYVGNDKRYCGINELKNINNLKGCLHISGLENVDCETNAKEASLDSKMYLETLCLQWSCSMLDIEDEDSIEISEKVLQNLQPNKNLQGLAVRNYPGNVFPIWIGDPYFSKLVSVILDNCPNCNTFPTLGRLPSLKVLSVQKMFSVETKEIHGGSCAIHNANKFPSLEILNIWEMYDLGELFVIRDGDYPRLHTLSISMCPMLITIPELPSLLELSIHSCTQLSKIPKLSSLLSLKLEGLHKIISLELHDNLSMLNKLEINHCSELLSLDGLSLLTYLEKLRLIECPKLNLPDSWQPHSFQKYLYTRVYGNREDIDDISEEHSLKLETAEKVILALKWKSSPLFESPKESLQYLSAIDDLLSLSFNPVFPYSFPYSYWDRVDSILQSAMLRLVDEFCRLASPTQGYFSSYLHHLPDRTSLESPDTVLDFPLFTPPLLLDLFSTYTIPKESLQYLKEIADRMIRAHRKTELHKAYVDSRRKALADCLAVMGVANLSTKEVQLIDWPVLDQKIKKCIQMMKVIHEVLHEEKSACEIIFGSSSMKEECFNEVAKGSVLQLFNFGTAVAVRKRTPEKLFRIVAMYEALIELILHLEALFSGKTRVHVIEEAKGTMACLGDAVKGTIFEFGNLIHGETSKKPLKYGDTDPLIRYVMKYICLLVGYNGSHNNLLASEDGQSGINCGIGTSAAEGVLMLIAYLENNLEEKKKLYDDDEWQHLFMMNNLLYIMQKVRGSVLKVLLGENWLSKTRHRIRQYMRGYSRSTGLIFHLS